VATDQVWLRFLEEKNIVPAV